MNSFNRVQNHILSHPFTMIAKFKIDEHLIRKGCSVCLAKRKKQSIKSLFKFV